MNWIQLAYQYLVGGLFFAVSLFLCFRPGASRTRNSSDRRTLSYCLVGLGAYFALTVLWILLASE